MNNTYEEVLKNAAALCERVNPTDARLVREAADENAKKEILAPYIEFLNSYFSHDEDLLCEDINVSSIHNLDDAKQYFSQKYRNIEIIAKFKKAYAVRDELIIHLSADQIDEFNADPVIDDVVCPPLTEINDKRYIPLAEDEEDPDLDLNKYSSRRDFAAKNQCFLYKNRVVNLLDAERDVFAPISLHLDDLRVLRNKPQL